MDSQDPEKLSDDDSSVGEKPGLVLWIILIFLLLAFGHIIYSWLNDPYFVGGPESLKKNSLPSDSLSQEEYREAEKISEEFIVQINSGKLPPEEEDKILDNAENIKIGDRFIVVSHLETEDYLTGLLFQLKKAQNNKAIEHQKIKICLYDNRFLKSKEAGAFSFYGSIYISIADFLDFEDEAEVVAMLGHELGHITFRHAADSRKISKNAIVLENKLSKQKDKKKQRAFYLAMLKIFGSRYANGIDGRMYIEGELAADKFSQLLLQKMGYDDLAALKFFNRMKNEINAVPVDPLANIALQMRLKDLSLEKIEQRTAVIRANHFNSAGMLSMGRLFIFSSFNELKSKQNSFRKHLESLDSVNQ